MVAKLSSMSRNYVRVRVTVARPPDATEAPDITLDPVEFAFTENPEDADWHAGSWEVAETSTGGRVTKARVLVGPGAVTLARGMHPVLLRITDNPERPVDRSGYLIVY